MPTERHTTGTGCYPIPRATATTICTRAAWPIGASVVESQTTTATTTDGVGTKGRTAASVANRHADRRAWCRSQHACGRNAAATATTARVPGPAVHATATATATTDHQCLDARHAGRYDPRALARGCKCADVPTQRCGGRRRTRLCCYLCLHLHRRRRDARAVVGTNRKGVDKAIGIHGRRPDVRLTRSNRCNARGDGDACLQQRAAVDGLDTETQRAVARHRIGGRDECCVGDREVRVFRSTIKRVDPRDRRRIDDRHQRNRDGSRWGRAIDSIRNRHRKCVRPVGKRRRHVREPAEACVGNRLPSGDWQAAKPEHTRRRQRHDRHAERLQHAIVGEGRGKRRRAKEQRDVLRTRDGKRTQRRAGTIDRDQWRCHRIGSRPEVARQIEGLSGKEAWSHRAGSTARHGDRAGRPNVRAGTEDAAGRVARVGEVARDNASNRLGEREGVRQRRRSRDDRRVGCKAQYRWRHAIESDLRISRQRRGLDVAGLVGGTRVHVVRAVGRDRAVDRIDRRQLAQDGPTASRRSDGAADLRIRQRRRFGEVGVDRCQRACVRSRISECDCREVGRRSRRSRKRGGNNRVDRDRRRDGLGSCRSRGARLVGSTVCCEPGAHGAIRAAGNRDGARIARIRPGVENTVDRRARIREVRTRHASDRLRKRQGVDLGQCVRLRRKRRREGQHRRRRMVDRDRRTLKCHQRARVVDRIVRSARRKAGNQGALVAIRNRDRARARCIVDARIKRTARRCTRIREVGSRNASHILRKGDRVRLCQRVVEWQRCRGQRQH